MTRLTRHQLAALIPHAGAMCLLDSVEHWNATAITCLTTSHRNPDNPLRRADGRLGAATGIELAGQAAALHGALTAGPTAAPRIGYLASLRDIHLATADLPASEPPLTITATLLMGDPSGASYKFSISHEATPVLAGRFTIMFASPEK